LPALVVRLPLAPKPRNHRRRQVRSLLAQQGRERFLEVAHRHAAQVQDRQQGIQAPAPPGPARQNGRGEADALDARLANSTVAQLDPLHRDRADPGLNQALRAVAVPDNALAPVRQPLALHLSQERLGFRLDGLGQQPARAAPQNRRQRIIDIIGLTEGNNGGSACHGVSAPSGVQAGFHPPRYAALLKPSSPILRHSSSAETQAAAMDLSARDLLVRQRTQLVNAVRGHAAEFGVIAAKGIAQVEPLLKKVTDSDMPQAAKETLAHLGRVIAQLDAQLAEINRRLTAQHKANPVSQRLAAIPGVGPLTALTVAMKVDAGQFESARHFAAWLGLTPKERSTGSRQSLGGISRAGNERLRQLLVVGAMAVIRHAKPGSKTASPWLLQLLERRPRKVAAVALANKMARTVWAMMANDTAYRRTPQAA